MKIDAVFGSIALLSHLFCFSVKSSVRTVATGRVAGSSAAVSAAPATQWTDAAAVRPAGQAGGRPSPPGRNFGFGSQNKTGKMKIYLPEILTYRNGQGYAICFYCNLFAPFFGTFFTVFFTCLL